MRDVILILNAGSSSLKFSVFTADERLELLIRGQIQSLDTAPTFQATSADGRIIGERRWEGPTALRHAEAIDYLLKWTRQEGLRDCRPIAAGHRVVHGGTRFKGPVLIDTAIVAALDKLVPLAPLHQPHNLAAIAAVARHAPDLPQVACFDTAFHVCQLPLAQIEAIPREYTEAGIRRYGFHGLSYEYIAGALAAIDPAAAAGRTIVAHLGNGASMCALHAGRSIATTMGFTTLDGLVMGTRCGAIDPGVILHLWGHMGLNIDDIQRLLYQRSGLLGVSGVSSNMRALLESDDPHAREAVDLFVYRASREIGSLAAALGGLDAVVFTGGIGENAALVRLAICRASQWLGVEIDEQANSRGGPGISRPGGRVSAWVVGTNEELMIARHTMGVLHGTQT